MMQIKKGSLAALTKSKDGKNRKVWKKTNQWFYCPACMVLYFFRVFKCRFDWNAPITCECGCLLAKAPDAMCREAKEVFPHFKAKIGSPRKGAEWYYGIYLKSALWRTIRGRVLNRDNGTCQRCGLPATVVHHKSYEDDVLAGNNDAMLVTLCFGCHEFIEFDGVRKVSLTEANARLAGKRGGLWVKFCRGERLSWVVRTGST